MAWLSAWERCITSRTRFTSWRLWPPARAISALSTRIARFTPGRRTDLAGEPAAYLLDEGEANSDWTNFWIFSDLGLRRLLHRSGWRVLDYLVAGSGEQAEPAASDADARAFCLAQSRLVDLEAICG